MKDFINRLETKKQKLDLNRPLPPELVKNLDEWFKIELTYTSNAIEGNTLTRQETALVVEKGLTVAGKSIKEHLEATNHAFALNYIKNLIGIDKTDLKLLHIMNLHRLILKKIDDLNAGAFRKIAVKIAGSDAIFPEPIKVPDLMNELIVWLHETKEHVVKVCADAHFKLVKIHPFVYGNGRTARLVMNLLLMQKGWPPALIKKEERLQYVNSIEKADKENNFDDYYQYICHAIETSLDIYLKAIEESNTE